MSKVGKVDTATIITAIHELGHAVVARLISFPSGACSIIAMDDTAGISISATVPECERVWQQRGWVTNLGLLPIEARIVVAMGGVAAELELLGDHCGGHEADWEQINELAGNDEILKDALWNYTCDLVHEYREVIKGMVPILINAQYLSGTEIDQHVEALRAERVALAEAS
jgi:hypothetical protein